jgi:hypothetical protein
VVPLFCEVNSVCLHLRQLAKMAKIDQKGRFFRLLVKTNIGAFCFDNSLNATRCALSQ